MAIPVLVLDKIAPDQMIRDNSNVSNSLDNNSLVQGVNNVELSKYMRYIDGYVLTVNYYSIIKGLNGTNTLLDVNDNTQQYTLISKLVTHMTSPLSLGSNYGDMSIETIIDANMTPSINDIVELRLANGIMGLFRVSNVEKKTYMRRLIYTVTLDYLYNKVDNVDYYQSLMSKIKKRFVYDDDLMANGESPLILENSYTNRVALYRYGAKLIESYVSEYLYEGVISYLADDGARVYDSGVSDLVLSTMIYKDQYAKIKYIEDANIDTVLSNIVRGNPLRLDNVVYSIDDVVYDSLDSTSVSLLSSGITRRVVEKLSDSLTGGDTPDIVYGIPDIYRIDTNQYLFGPEFYLRVGVLSQLEKLLSDYMDNDSVSYDELMTLADGSSEWNYIERFYYVPLIVLLINYSMASNHDRL